MSGYNVVICEEKKKKRKERIVKGRYCQEAYIRKINLTPSPLHRTGV